MTYLTYAALPEAVNVDDLCEKFASIEYLDGIMSKYNAESRRQSLSALLLLSKTLELAGVDSKALTLKRDENGRPYAADRSDLDFSLSHTKGATACAVMLKEGARVGVDLEEIQPQKRAELIAKRFFSEVERRHAYDFVEIWTKKEALYKYLKDPTNDLRELDTDSRKMEKFDSIDTEYGKISLCRNKKAADEPKIIKIFLKN